MTDRYGRRGYRVVESGTLHLGTGQIVDHCDAFIRALDRPPIVMGHAVGGAIAENLLERGFAARLDSIEVEIMCLPQILDEPPGGCYPGRLTIPQPG